MYYLIFIIKYLNFNFKSFSLLVTIHHHLWYLIFYTNTNSLIIKNNIFCKYQRLRIHTSTFTSLILLGTRPHPKKARNTRDIKNGGERFECVNYCLWTRNNTPSENNMATPAKCNRDKWKCGGFCVMGSGFCYHIHTYK